MSKKGRMATQQQGAALFVALIILLIISFMGVSAMRSSIMGERMAFNTQARELTFQAAETAINGVMSQARHDSGLLNKIMSTNLHHCIHSANGLVEGACGASGAFDERQLMQAEADSTYVGQRIAFDNDISVVADYQFRTLGKGNFVATANLPFANRNLQEWRKLGPSGQFEVSDTRVIGITPIGNGAP